MNQNQNIGPGRRYKPDKETPAKQLRDHQKIPAKKNYIVLAIVLIGVLVIGVVAYNALSDRVKPEITLAPPETDTEVVIGAVEDTDSGVDEDVQAPSSNEETDIEQADQEEDDSDKEAVPDIIFLDKNDQDVSLSSFQGKPVVLNFWASWCPPCRGEMPGFDLVYQEYGKDINFIMLALTDGQGETVETASNFVKDQGFSFPVYFDVYQEGAYAFGIQSIPATFFIDKNGYLITIAIGAINESTLLDGIELIK